MMFTVSVILNTDFGKIFDGRTKMRVLVVGGGGRNMRWCGNCGKAPVSKIYCAPGNAGIAGLAECVHIAADDIANLVKFAEEQKIDLTVVGPEAPLAAGIADAFRAKGLQVFGPVAAAARLEASKAFAKQLMQKYGIPTAESRTFTAAEDALAYIRQKGAPIVVKADGLAAGKGVIVAQTVAEAEAAVKRMLVAGEFGAAAGDCGGAWPVKLLLALPTAAVWYPWQAPRTIRPPTTTPGPNTGGMGAYSPRPS